MELNVTITMENPYAAYSSTDSTLNTRKRCYSLGDNDLSHSPERQENEQLSDVYLVHTWSKKKKKKHRYEDGSSYSPQRQDNDQSSGDYLAQHTCRQKKKKKKKYKYDDETLNSTTDGGEYLSDSCSTQRKKKKKIKKQKHEREISKNGSENLSLSRTSVESEILFSSNVEVFSSNLSLEEQAEEKEKKKTRKKKKKHKSDEALVHSSEYLDESVSDHCLAKYKRKKKGMRLDDGKTHSLVVPENKNIWPHENQDDLEEEDEVLSAFTAKHFEKMFNDTQSLDSGEVHPPSRALAHSEYHDENMSGHCLAKDKKKKKKGKHLDDEIPHSLEEEKGKKKRKKKDKKACDDEHELASPQHEEEITSSRPSVKPQKPGNDDGPLHHVEKSIIVNQIQLDSKNVSENKNMWPHENPDDLEEDDEVLSAFTAKHFEKMFNDTQSLDSGELHSPSRVLAHDDGEMERTQVHLCDNNDDSSYRSDKGIETESTLVNSGELPDKRKNSAPNEISAKNSISAECSDESVALFSQAIENKNETEEASGELLNENNVDVQIEMPSSNNVLNIEQILEERDRGTLTQITDEIQVNVSDNVAQVDKIAGQNGETLDGLTENLDSAMDIHEDKNALPQQHNFDNPSWHTNSDEGAMNTPVQQEQRASNEENVNQVGSSSGSLMASGGKQHKAEVLHCYTCRLTFSNLSDWASHMGLHSSKILYKCSVCEKGFVSEENFKMHKEIAHKHETSQDSDEDSLFSDNSDGTGQGQTGADVYECDSCHETFLVFPQFIEHVLRRKSITEHMTINSNQQKQDMDVRKCGETKHCEADDEKIPDTEKKLNVTEQMDTDSKAPKKNITESKINSTAIDNENAQDVEETEDQMLNAGDQQQKCKISKERADGRPNAASKVRTRKVYTCKYCKKSIDRQSRLERHERICEMAKAPYNRDGCCEILALQCHIAKTHKVTEDSDETSQLRSNGSEQNSKMYGSNTVSSSTGRKRTEKQHQCVLCNEVFHRGKELKKHEEAHMLNKEKGLNSNEEVHTLSEMSNAPNNNRSSKEDTTGAAKQSKTDEIVPAHITKIHVFSCKLCQEEFDCRQLLKVHQKSHDECQRIRIQYVCDQCPKTFDRLPRLEKHHQKSHPIKPYQCHQCEERFINKEELRKHQRRHDSTRTKQTGSVIEKGNNERGNKTVRKANTNTLKSRKTENSLPERRTQKNNNESAQVKEVYKSNTCSSKMFTRDHSKKLDKTEEKVEVNISEKVKRQTKNSAKSRNPTISKVNACFAMRRRRTSEHKKTTRASRKSTRKNSGQTADKHENSQSYSSKLRVRCDQCGEFFRGKLRLERHIRTHVLERQRRSNATKGAKSDTLMNASPSKEKSTRCRICKKSFTHSITLMRHMQMHNGNHSFACTKCKKFFPNRIQWIKHAKTQHDKR